MQQCKGDLGPHNMSNTWTPHTLTQNQSCTTTWTCYFRQQLSTYSACNLFFFCSLPQTSLSLYSVCYTMKQQRHKNTVQHIQAIVLQQIVLNVFDWDSLLSFGCGRTCVPCRRLTSCCGFHQMKSTGLRSREDVCVCVPTHSRTQTHKLD